MPRENEQASLLHRVAFSTMAAFAGVVGVSALAEQVATAPPAAANDVEAASFTCTSPTLGTLEIDASNFRKDETREAQVRESFKGKVLWDASVEGNGAHNFPNVKLPAGNFIVRILSNHESEDATKLSVDYTNCEPPAVVPEGPLGQGMAIELGVGAVGVGSVGYMRRRRARLNDK